MPSVSYYMELVEQAWKLSDDAREYVKAAKSENREVSIQECLDKIFLKSPYGLQYRPEYNDWIPFRHGDVKFDD